MSLDAPTPRADGIARLAPLGNPGSEMAREDEMTPQEVADLLGVSPSTVRRYEDSGVLTPKRRLPGSRHRRYDRVEVERLAAESESDDR